MCVFQSRKSDVHKIYKVQAGLGVYELLEMEGVKAKCSPRCSVWNMSLFNFFIALKHI